MLGSHFLSLSILNMLAHFLMVIEMSDVFLSLLSDLLLLSRSPKNFFFLSLVILLKSVSWYCFCFCFCFLNVSLINLFIFYILFLAVLGLRFCARALSSCGERGPLFTAVRGPLTIAASLIAEHRLQTRRLSSCGSRA